MEFTYDSLFHVMSLIDEKERLSLRLVSKLFNEVVILLFPKRPISELITGKKTIPAMYFLQNLSGTNYNINSIFNSALASYDFRILEYIVKFELLSMKDIWKKVYKTNMRQIDKDKFDKVLSIFAVNNNYNRFNPPDYKFLIKNGMVNALRQLMSYLFIRDESIESLVIYAIRRIKQLKLRNEIIDILIENGKNHHIYGDFCEKTFNTLIEIDDKIANDVLYAYDDEIIYDKLCRNDKVKITGKLHNSYRRIKKKYKMNEQIIMKRIASDHNLNENSFSKIYLPDELYNCPLSIYTDSWNYSCELEINDDYPDLFREGYFDYIEVTALYSD